MEKKTKKRQNEKNINIVTTIFMVIMPFILLTASVLIIMIMDVKIDSNSRMYDNTLDYNIVDDIINLDGCHEFVVKEAISTYEISPYDSITYFVNDNQTIELNSTNVNIGDFIETGTALGMFGLDEITAAYNMIVVDKQLGNIVVRNLDKVYADILLEIENYSQYIVGDEVRICKNGEYICKGTVSNVDYINLYDDKLKVIIQIDNSETKFFANTSITVSQDHSAEFTIFTVDAALTDTYFDNVTIQAFMMDNMTLQRVNVVLKSNGLDSLQILRIINENKDIQIKEGMRLYAKSDFIFA